MADHEDAMIELMDHIELKNLASAFMHLVTEREYYKEQLKDTEKRLKSKIGSYTDLEGEVYGQHMEAQTQRERADDLEKRIENGATVIQNYENSKSQLTQKIAELERMINTQRLELKKRGEQIRAYDADSKNF